MRKTDDKPTSMVSKRHFYSHEIELKLGNWKKHFDFNYRSTVIVMALNHFIKEHELVVNGYLITTKSLFLIVKTEKKSIDELVEKIELHIAFLLKKYDNKFTNSISKDDFLIEMENILYTVHQPLFKLKMIKSNYLIKLITGQKIDIPYYDPELEYLKLLIKNHPFCSSIDYSGALGPVEIVLLET